MCALPAKEDSNYLTPMPLDNLCCLVRDGECVDPQSKDRPPFESFWKAVFPTPKIQDVNSEPDLEWMNRN